MEANIEAAGDVVTGTVVAKALDDGPAGSGTHATGTLCKNCKAPISSKFCGACGQIAHPHRSLVSLGHDILHGVFHVEGRIWRTLPELFFKPGRLTRRYIDGERAKFIAPFPLFLFSVFFLFAVIAFSPSSTTLADKADDTVQKWRQGNASAVEASNKLIENLRAKLSDPAITPEQRVEVERRIAQLEVSLKSMQTLANSNWTSIAGQTKTQQSNLDDAKVDIDFVEANAGNKWATTLRNALQNRTLLLYKLKTNIYKYSWALIPISVPFLWLLYFWRRDIYVYDHAIFITYSMSFVLLFLALLSIAGTLGLSGGWRASIFGIAAPIHLYKQMRHAYGSSRFGSFARLIVLSVFIGVIVVAFFVGLLVLGLIG